MLSFSLELYAIDPPCFGVHSLSFCCLSTPRMSRIPTPPQSQTVTFVRDQQRFEIDLSTRQISSRMLLRMFNVSANCFIYYSVFELL